MSDPEGFVARWSRLKRETVQDQADPDGATAKVGATAEPGEVSPIALPAGGDAPPPFDPASLPSIDSITAGSDIRAFLQSGVPAELTKAALRRVWTTDPAIRDFIGIAENQWDFTDPTAMPGFGPLEATDDVGKLVAQAMGKIDDALKPDAETVVAQVEPDAAAVHPVSGVSEAGASENVAISAHVSERPEPDSDEEQRTDDVAVAPQHDSPDAEDVLPRRLHGGALPR